MLTVFLGIFNVACKRKVRVQDIVKGFGLSCWKGRVNKMRKTVNEMNLGKDDEELNIGDNKFEMSI